MELLKKIVDDTYKINSDSFIPNNEKNDIVNKIISYKETNSLLYNSYLIDDLELFTNKTLKKSLFNHINTTYTKFGEVYLQNILKYPSDDITFLNNRQNILKKIINKDFIKIRERLKLIEYNENDVLWFFKKSNEETIKLLESVYFKNQFLSKINTNQFILSFYYHYKIILSPIFIILSPITFLLVPYLILKNIFKININFFSYFTALKIGISNFNDIININKNFSIKSNISVIGSIIFYILLYLHNIYISIDSALNANNIIRIIHKKLSNVAKFLKNIYLLNEATYQIFDNYKLKICFEELNNKIFFSDYDIFSNKKGMILTTFINLKKNKNKLFDSLNYLGKIDAYYSIANLFCESKIKDKSLFCFPKYLSLKKPFLNCNRLWHPFLDPNKVIFNDISLGKNSNNKINNIIITGPNASGKSTIMKALCLSILFSQTITISCCKDIYFTPFTKLNTYLNIPDCAGKESLFEAEMRRILEYINELEILPDNKFSFVIIDEILSSTNPIEGISGAYSIAKYIGGFKNNISIISTHFNYLSKLQKKTKKFVNFKLPILIKEKEFLYTYKLEKGISNQFIALDLLEKKGFKKSIIRYSKKICKKISTPLCI